MTFVVVGGGPTGVELAGALGEIANDTLKRDFRSIDPSQARIILVEAMERILPPYPPDRSASAKKQLEKLGVDVRTGTRVVAHRRRPASDVTGRRHGGALPARTVLWAAGVQVSSFVAAVAEATGAEQDRAGRILVGPDLTIPGHPEIFVVGDAAVQPWKEGRPAPGVAQGAIQGGALRVAGDPAPRCPARPTQAVPVQQPRRRRGHRPPGRRHRHPVDGAVRPPGRVPRLGAVAADPHHVPDRVREPGRRRDALGWSFFTHGRGSRLITGEPLLPPIEEPEPPA